MIKEFIKLMLLRNIADSTGLRKVYDPNSIIVELYFGHKLQPIHCVAVTYDSDTYVTSDPNSCQNYDTCELLNVDLANVDTTIDYSDFSRMISTGDTIYGSYVNSKLGIRLNDTVHSFSNSTFAIASSSDVPICVLGLGPQNGESTGVQIENGIVSPTYQSLPVLLKNNGLIASTSYSLFIANNEGSLEFGTVDHTRYEGALQLVPIIDFSEEGKLLEHTKAPLEIQVVLLGVSLESNGVLYPVLDMEGPALLAIGMQATFLPQKFLDELVGFYGLLYDTGLGGYLAPCDLPGSLVFNISGVSVTTPLHDYLTETDLTFSDQKNACLLQLPPTGNVDYWALGNSLAMSNYIAVDLDSLVIGVAPLKIGTDVLQGDIESIPEAFEKAVPAPILLADSYNTSDITVEPLPKAKKTYYLNSGNMLKTKAIYAIGCLITYLYIFL